MCCICTGFVGSHYAVVESNCGAQDHPKAPSCFHCSAVEGRQPVVVNFHHCSQHRYRWLPGLALLWLGFVGKLLCDAGERMSPWYAWRRKELFQKE